MMTPSSMQLLERSSLGTAGARRLRQRIPHAEAKSISQLADLLEELRQDPEIRSLAQRYAGNPSLAADALQAAFYATAAIKHPDRIDNLRAYFIRVLKHEAYRLCASAIEDPGQHGAAAGAQAPSRPIDETVQARSDDPSRYRTVVYAAAEQVLRDGITGESSEADPNVRDTLGQYRRELTGYCYRMLGSASEADDAVQETMLRAWRAADGFEGRSSVRSWLYRIATNICLGMLRDGSARRGPRPPVEALLGDRHPDDTSITPITDNKVMPEHGDPADIAVARDTTRLAFVTALQHLPPRQRATLTCARW